MKIDKDFMAKLVRTVLDDNFYTVKITRVQIFMLKI